MYYKFMSIYLAIMCNYVFNCILIIAFSIVFFPKMGLDPPVQNHSFTERILTHFNTFYL